MLLTMVQAIIVKIMGLAWGSVMIQTVNRTTKKFKNKDIKDLAPFFTPIPIININNIIDNKEKYNPMGMVRTMPIPPAKARASSKDRFIDNVKPSGEQSCKYKIRIDMNPLL